MQEVRLMGRKESNASAGLPGFRRGIMMACRHIWGIFAVRKDSLKRLRRQVLPFGPNSMRKACGISSRPGAPFLFMALSTASSSCMEKVWQLLQSTAGALTHRLASLTVARSCLEM